MLLNARLQSHNRFSYLNRVIMRHVITGTIWLVVLFSVAIVFSVAADDELISNPSFEIGNDEDAWSLSERTALWSVTSHAAESTPDYVRFNNAVSRSGQRSLSLGPWRFQTGTAIFVSQYRNLAGASVDAPLVLSFWSRGIQSQRLKVSLDVSYNDNRFLFLEVKPVSVSEDRDEFVRTCTFIPNHGSIRAIMLHLVIEVSLDEVIYVDDVSLRRVQLLESQSTVPECQLYTSSFPVERQVLSRFLSPSRNNDDTAGHRITLATQLTKDRLGIVEETAAIWQGPISAALLLYGQPSAEEMAKITTRYYSSQALQAFVTLHVVWEDPLNKRDEKMYPANALRNVAIAHSTTEFVFYVDADMFPAFSEAQARQWLSESVERAKVFSKHSMCERCAFIVPLFNWASQTTAGYPQTKEELKVRVRDPSSGITGCQLLSHAVTDYNRWLTSSETYRADYVDDMEPYFIVTSTAPVMNDVYAGYGWDKCAYSRDLRADGFEFYVLPEAFVINLLDTAGSGSTIMGRGMGLDLRLFLNSAFHKNDLMHGHIRYPTTYRSKSHDYEHITQTLASSTKDSVAEKNPQTDETPTTQEVPATKETLSTKETPATKKTQATKETQSTGDVNSEPVDKDGGIGCNAVFFDMKLSLIPEIVIASDNHVPDKRKDILIERLMKAYGVYTFVEVPALRITGSLRYMLPFVHPEALVSLLPGSDSDEHIIKDVFHEYRTKGNVTEGLGRVVADHPDPKLYAVNVDRLSEAEAMEYVLACLKRATDEDVILIDDGIGTKPDSFWSHLFSDTCVTHANWRTYRKSSFVMMKSELLRNAPPLALPPLPDCVEHFQPHSDQTTDILLFSKNRPLQTFAFMDSLKRFVTGLNKVWLLLKTEDAIFDRGYEMIVDCFSSYVPIEIVRQSSSATFGSQILNIINSSSADSVMFAVDEIIWLRPVNLSVVSSLLHDCDHSGTSTFQLRLGENIRCLGPANDYSTRFHPFAFDADISAFYPRRLPYDFGYVLNVDGVVARRKDLIEDLRGFLWKCPSPGCLEQGWITHRLHARSRQWHFMYRRSRMVNNMGMSDGRVADRHQGPAEGSYQLARILVEERKRIDVESFVRTNRNHANTHQTSPVDFVDLDC